MATWLGKSLEVHCSALGKVLIAYLPEEDLNRIVREHGLPRLNENTIVSPANCWRNSPEPAGTATP